MHPKLCGILCHVDICLCCGSLLSVLRECICLDGKQLAFVNNSQFLQFHLTLYAVAFFLIISLFERSGYDSYAAVYEIYIEGMEDDTFDFFDDSPRETKGSHGDSNVNKQVQEIQKSEHLRQTEGSSGQNSRDDSNVQSSNSPRVKVHTKIEAKVPRVLQTSQTDSDSDTDDSQAHDRVGEKPVDQHRRLSKGSSKGSDESFSSQSSNFSSGTNNSDVTDVSPLQTPAYTPKSRKYVSSELSHYSSSSSKKPPTPKRSGSKNGSDAKELNGKSDKVQRVIDKKGGTMNMELLMQAMMEIDGKSSHDRHDDKGHVHFDTPSAAAEARNYSFSVDKAKAIDKENRRLLQKLMRYDQGNWAVGQKQPAQRTKKPAPNMTPSAVNRQRDLERIDKENQMILKRLERAKPSSHLERNKLLHEYNNKTMAGHSIAGAHYRQKRTTKSDTSFRSPNGDYALDREFDAAWARPQSAYPSQQFAASRPASGRQRPWSADRKSNASEDEVQRRHFPRPRPTWDSRW